MDALRLPWRATSGASAGRFVSASPLSHDVSIKARPARDLCPEEEEECAASCELCQARPVVVAAAPWSRATASEARAREEQEDSSDLGRFDISTRLLASA
ncbi:hypothetical protein HPB50_017208 [Hyalomma asiaticum]|uniref:Uncharacterized protein n=1 Tax=Hyalomma asiaticum TaxID=266040 RepID=A0ACB7S6W7_HYAAI|nr:hypothetical protein HPB50_017208 [Hyalomma asiaticum]